MIGSSFSASEREDANILFYFLGKSGLVLILHFSLGSTREGCIPFDNGR